MPTAPAALVADVARAILNAEMTRRGISQRRLADFLGWSQSRVGKLLVGRTRLRLDELDALCGPLGLSLTTVLRACDVAARKRRLTPTRA